jgi:hypothetical protein
VARRDLGVIIADIGQKRRLPHRHAAVHFDELDKLPDKCESASRETCERSDLGLC